MTGDECNCKACQAEAALSAYGKYTPGTIRNHTIALLDKTAALEGEVDDLAKGCEQRDERLGAAYSRIRELEAELERKTEALSALMATELNGDLDPTDAVLEQARAALSPPDTKGTEA